MKKRIATIHYWAGQYEALTLREGRRTILGHHANRHVLAKRFSREYRIVCSMTNPLAMSR